jgi:hypothetical protein
MNAMPRTQQREPKTAQTGASLPSPVREQRLSPGLRNAVSFHVRNGLTIKQACQTAGISEAWWHKAKSKPAFRDLLLREQTEYIQEVESLRAGYKARAFEVACDLMHNAKSESVRMRAVEFLAGEPRQPGVVVQVSNAAPGYTYARPVNRASTSDAAQPIEIEGKADPV